MRSMGTGTRCFPHSPVTPVFLPSTDFCQPEFILAHLPSMALNSGTPSDLLEAAPGQKEKRSKSPSGFVHPQCKSLEEKRFRMSPDVLAKAGGHGQKRDSSRRGTGWGGAAGEAADPPEERCPWPGRPRLHRTLRALSRREEPDQP